MSNLLNVTCPQCQTKLQVQRPAAERATVRCRCGNRFTFKVPASGPKTGAFAEAPSDPFADLPSAPAGSGPPGGPLSSPDRFSASTVRSRGKGGTGASVPWSSRPNVKTKRARPAWLKPVLVASLSLVATGVVVAGAFAFLKETSLLPASVASVFDSPEAIWDDANENDLAVKAFVERYLADPASVKDDETLGRLKLESRKLVARAAVLDPLSVAEAAELGDGFSEGERTGPLSDEDLESLSESLYERGNNERNFMRSVVGTIFAQNDFAREFLKYGHVEFSDLQHEGEEIAADRIRLLRQFNRKAGEIALKEFGAQRELKSKEAFKAYVDELYEPLFDETESIAQQMQTLAVELYKLPRNQLGNVRQFREALYYVNQARAQVMFDGLALMQSKAEILSHVAEMKRASGEFERAAAGLKPTRLAEAEAAEREQEAERKRREQERQDRIAAEQRERQQKIEEEKRAAETPDPNATASNESERRPASPADAFGGRGPSRGPRARAGGEDSDSGAGPRFGPRFGPRSGRRSEMQGRAGQSRMPRSGSSRLDTNSTERSAAPVFNPATGVTIKVSQAGHLSAGNHTQKMSRALSSSVHWRSSGGQVTVQLSYTGPLEDVVELIDFGTVKSVDEASRLIIVEAGT